MFYKYIIIFYYIYIFIIILFYKRKSEHMNIKNIWNNNNNL